jgi:hypothetical protein
VKQPADLAQQREANPQLPPGPWERVTGYGVMGLPFRSGHVLGLRRWTASSIGEGFTSIWHRDPEGSWTFYETAPCEVACTRYFGGGVDRVYTEPIELQWEGPKRLRVRTVRDGGVDWTIEVGASLVTGMMSAVGSALPVRVWRSRPVLGVMGHVAGWALRAGTVRLTGMTANAQPFAALRRQPTADLVRHRQSRHGQRGRPWAHWSTRRASPPGRLLFPSAGHLRDGPCLR